MPVQRIAVVGAGLAGLAAARALADAGAEVVVWEKSRGVGGRTATRRSPVGRFDHGAPVLHDGARPLAGLDGVAAHRLDLPDGPLDVAVGAPAANAPAKALAAGLDVRAGIRVGGLDRDGAGWALRAQDGAPLGTWEAVVVAIPAPQAAELLAVAAPALAQAAAGVAWDPCWAVMAAWAAPLELGRTAARDAHGLAWAVAEAPKPGREPGERWVLQLDAERSAAHLEDDPEDVAAEALERFARLAGTTLPALAHLAAHRWRFARPRTPLREDHLRAGGLLVAGDWCGGADAGAALRSGRAAAGGLERT